MASSKATQVPENTKATAAPAAPSHGPKSHPASSRNLNLVSALPAAPASIPAQPLGPASPPPAAPLLPLQRKLSIGSTNDPLEAEADAAAMAATDSRSARPTPRVRRLQTPPPSDPPPIVHQVLRSPGQALDSSTRRWAEPAFQTDFRAVRLHTGAQAESSATAIQARAYTVGSDIVLGPGSHSAGPEYRRLLAHELAHVVQQGMAPPRAISQPAAESSSAPAVPARAPVAHRTAGPVIQRQEAEAPIPETGGADLGWITEGLITLLSAPAKAVGDTAYALVRSTWHGFFAELKSHSGDIIDKIKGRIKEFATSPSELLMFFPKYWWGSQGGLQPHYRHL